MSKLAAIIWITFIFVGTCTSSVSDLFENGVVHFLFVPTPDLSAFFPIYPLDRASEVELIGHAFIFFILASILIIALHDSVTTFMMATCIAITSEFLQPFFGRSADIYDLAANVIGITVIVVSWWIVNSIERFVIN